MDEESSQVGSENDSKTDEDDDYLGPYCFRTEGEFQNIFKSLEDSGVNHLSKGGSVVSELPSLPGLVMLGRNVQFPIADTGLFEFLEGKLAHDNIGKKSMLDIPLESVVFKNPEWKPKLELFLENIKKLFAGRDREVCTSQCKLLLYRSGNDLLVPDAGVEPGLFGNLLIHFPSIYRGGALNVKHGNRVFRYDYADESPFKIHYTVNLVDLEQQFEQITEGCRLMLVCNLIWGDRVPRPILSDVERQYELIRTMLKNSDMPNMNALPFEFKYSKGDLQDKGLIGLKGADFRRAWLVRNAIKEFEIPDMDVFIVHCEMYLKETTDNHNVSEDCVSERYMTWYEVDSGRLLPHLGALKMDAVYLDCGEEILVESVYKSNFWKFENESLENPGHLFDVIKTYPRTVLLVWKNIKEFKDAFGSVNYLKYCIYCPTGPYASQDLLWVNSDISLRENCPSVISTLIDGNKHELVRSFVTVTSQIPNAFKLPRYSSRDFQIFSNYIDHHRELLSQWKAFFQTQNLSSDFLYSCVEMKLPKDMFWFLFNQCKWLDPDHIVEVLLYLEVEEFDRFERYDSYDLRRVYNEMCEHKNRFGIMKEKILIHFINMWESILTRAPQNKGSFIYPELSLIINMSELEIPRDVTERFTRVLVCYCDYDFSEIIAKCVTHCDNPSFKDVIVPEVCRFVREKIQNRQSDEILPNGIEDKLRALEEWLTF